MGSEHVQGGRVRGVTVVKPIVIGNTSTYLGGKRETDGHTHTWSVYLKPFKSEDMSVYVKKVHFKLHDSFSQPLRILSKPPYKVSESGWGEFEISIKVFFHDPTEKPVTFYHFLKLFKNDMVIMKEKMLISESYDEILFTDPTPLMYPLLVNAKPLDPTYTQHYQNFEDAERKTFTSIIEARRVIKTEIAQISEMIKRQREKYNNMKAEISELEEQTTGIS